MFINMAELCVNIGKHGLASGEHSIKSPEAHGMALCSPLSQIALGDWVFNAFSLLKIHLEEVMFPRLVIQQMK